jgi:hypothetical protein
MAHMAVIFHRQRSDGYDEMCSFDLDTRQVRLWLVYTNRWSVPFSTDAALEKYLPEDLLEWLPDD